MKRAISIFVSIILVGMLSFTNSCKKDNKIRGCTDRDSYTYSADAQEDDGSCLYEGSIVVWYDQAASDGLIADGATSLTFTLNGEYIGSTTTDIYWEAAPDCGSNGSVTGSEDLGKNKTQAYTLSVKDQDNFEYWNAVVNIDANTCLQFQLLWSKRKK
jgi:hypothetical protein